MSKLKEILTGWVNMTVGASPEVIAEANRRSRICAECPSSIGGANAYVCSECGCILRAKMLSPESKCPLNKWEDELQKNNPA